MANEPLHSVKINHCKSLVMKIDLVKTYDKVNWPILHLLLLNVGLSFEVTQWIMGCVSSANFVVLINGNPTDFFEISRGLCQGCPCPLLLLLFLFVIEGLSRMIQKDKGDGKIIGIKVFHSHYITQSLFVDDVLLFGIVNLLEWQNFKIILDRFCLDSKMEVSTQKSCLYYSNIAEDLCSHMKHSFS